MNKENCALKLVDEIILNVEFVFLFHDKTQKLMVVIVSRTVTVHTNQLPVFLALFSKLP